MSNELKRVKSLSNQSYSTTQDRGKDGERKTY